MKEKKIYIEICESEIKGKLKITEEDCQILKDISLNNIDLILVIPSMGISIKFRIDD